MSEVIRDNVDGLLFPPGDSEALAHIIERLCADRGLVKALQDNVPRPKSITEYTDELETLYQDILVQG
jgi:glycosyltransferase involved in cell wall biosynthesis